MASCPLSFAISSNLMSYEQHDLIHGHLKGFAKYCQCSPDGNSVQITYDGDNKLVILAMDSEKLAHRAYYGGYDSICARTADMFTVSSVMDCGESIYDSKWYPFANSQDPSTCCVITTCRDHPIHLWDTSSSQIRCSYVAHNHLDELDPAVSLAFNMTGDKIYAGYNKMIRCFDVNTPGLNHSDIPTTSSKHDNCGQKGIISAISFNPDHSKAYAAGSYASSIAVYVEDMAGAALELRDLDIKGVTCVKWSPCGNMLWAGGRNSCAIVCWDLRNTRTEIGRVQRNLATNQRMMFDIDPWGRYLATGSQDGKVLIYDTVSYQLIAESASHCHAEPINSTSCQADETPDCLHSVFFHPYSAHLMTCSGQRHFKDDFSDIDDVINAQMRWQRSACCLQAWPLTYTPISTASSSNSQESSTIVELEMT